ncbi:rhodanese-like domain-containing protein [Enterococcus sp. BWR-S5]|uniref:rhodanese-like domain-containing protein n=1 Tax=Enterococcus sp. BWR-S5 TaxID=2787714 RepID=UPI0019204ABE|nr:rhodanese-like domain-containing protein [Enterococcus sp. BWR-S5]MBL1225252.1 rhodanese-like domain-containing protein [Enterococcus sp. BWR-S5]
MYQTMMIPEFEQLMKQENVTVLDVRELDEFQSGHIEGAINLPLSGFPEAADSLDQEKEYHVICHSGSRSQMACEFLGSKGFTTTNIMGGMSAWRGAVV